VRRKTFSSESAASQALVDLLLPISRLMLESAIGVDELLGAAKHAYVKAAIAEVLPSGSRLNISRLSVATGLTRKDVSAVVRHFRGHRLGYPIRTKEQRALRVLRGWKADSRFHAPDGRPAQLRTRGEGNSFQFLVQQYAGDVTPTAVLRELERMRAVRITRGNALRLRSSRTRPRDRWAERATELARLFGDFAGTIASPRGAEKRPEFFGFRDCTDVLAEDVARFQRTFSKRGAALLESFEHWLASRGKSHSAGARARVGVGVYLVNSPQPRRGKTS
jgi:hypothetical protein